MNIVDILNSDDALFIPTDCNEITEDNIDELFRIAFNQAHKATKKLNRETRMLKLAYIASEAMRLGKIKGGTELFSLPRSKKQGIKIGTEYRYCYRSINITLEMAYNKDKNIAYIINYIFNRYNYTVKTTKVNTRSLVTSDIFDGLDTSEIFRKMQLGINLQDIMNEFDIERTCNRCGKTKHISEFSVYDLACKECRKKIKTHSTNVDDKLSKSIEKYKGTCDVDTKHTIKVSPMYITASNDLKTLYNTSTYLQDDISQISDLAELKVVNNELNIIIDKLHSLKEEIKCRQQDRKVKTV